jgi:hypothetical protein
MTVRKEDDTDDPWDAPYCATDGVPLLLCEKHKHYYDKVMQAKGGVVK